MKRNRWRSILLRAFEVWLVISAAETLHGAARISLLEPIIGDLAARQIAVFTGSLIILGAAYLFRKWIGAGSAREYLAVGSLWVGLTVFFEVLLARLVMEVSWQRIVSDYNVPSGGLMPFGLLLMLLAPLIVTRVHHGQGRLPEANGTRAA